MHKWSIVAASMPANPDRIVSVCRRCGEMRTAEAVPGIGKTGQMDLSGDCPAEPPAKSRRVIGTS